MTQLRHLHGLPAELLRPRQGEVSAVVSCGVKDKQSGAPIDKDCYTILEGKPIQHQGRKRKFDRRRLDRRFREFNLLPKQERRVFYGHLIHHNLLEAHEVGYFAYRLPSFQNPRTNAPACRGNGVEAQRWNASKRDGRGELGDYNDIECPGEGCPYRMPDSKGAYACKPGLRLWFKPVWKTVQGPKIARWTEQEHVRQLLERPEMRFSSPQGEMARETFTGMIKRVEDEAKRFEIPITSWFGLPFQMALGEGTNPAKGTRWPETSFTLDGEWMDWLRWQAGEFQALLDIAPVLMLGAVSPKELDAEERGDDYAAIMPVTTSKPAPVEPIDVEIIDELPEAVSASPPAPPPRPEAAGSFFKSYAGDGASGSDEALSEPSGSRVEQSRAAGASADPEEADSDSGDGDTEVRGAESAVAPAPTYYRTPEECDHPLHMREIIEDPESPGAACTTCGEVFPLGDDSPDFDPYDYLKRQIRERGYWGTKMLVVIPLRVAGILKSHENWSDVPPTTTKAELDAVLDGLEPRTE